MIDWKLLLTLCRRHRLKWAVCLAVVCVAGGVYYMCTPKSFSVNATLMIRSSESLNTTAQDEMMSMMGYGGEKKAQDEIEVLSSRHLMEQVLTALDMQTSCEQRGLRYWKRQYPHPALRVEYDTLPDKVVRTSVRVRKDGYDLCVRQGRFRRSSHHLTEWGQPVSTCAGVMTLYADSVLQSGARYRLTTKPMPELVDEYRRAISVSRLARESNIIRLSTTTTCPKAAEAVLNEMIRYYNLITTDDKNNVALSTARFISSRLEEVANQLSEIELQIEQYKRVHHISDLDKTAELYQNVSEQYDRTVMDMATQEQVLDYLSTFLRNPDNAHSPVPANLGVTDQTLVSLVATYNSEMMAYIRLSHSATENNPVMDNREQQLRVLRDNLLVSIRNVKQGLSIRRSNLSATGSNYQGKLDNVSEQEKGYVELQRRRQSIEELYLFLSRKQEENSLILSSQAVPARVVDEAGTDTRAVGPRLSGVVLIILLLGGVLPVVVMYMWHMRFLIRISPSSPEEQIRRWNHRWY